MLDSNSLRGHESFIPLNKVNSKIVEKETVDKLKKMLDGKVELAINVLKFDEKFKSAIALIFG